MPIFEYRCRSCGDEFELLLRSDAPAACPQCGSPRVDKKLSVFASHVRQSRDALPACHTGGAGCDLGKCGSGCCGVG